MYEVVPVAGDHKAALQSACLAQADSLQLWLKTQRIRSMAETPDLRTKGMMERSLCPLLLQKAASALHMPGGSLEGVLCRQRPLRGRAESTAFSLEAA